ncbi:I78 family peptidase inhibitor [Pseudooceanicola nanhaiensis]|uniref:I78 family peptidase inhibitor n=1 Tax=Pseudooceanicola nanhaiensis TaxID=375761 RepID=UPI001CD54895|nr:I78 family peptidase inhibitor [Pseudooceanicola nanhaiensis]MCA0921251.1 hypothetical protein [Pseudooceanicola nanhaiensis]
MMKTIVAAGLVLGVTAGAALAHDRHDNRPLNWPSSPQAQSTCGADLYSSKLQGKPYRGQFFREHDGPIRVLKPGDMMTMDHNPRRLNVILDRRGNMVGVRCG